MSEGDRKMGWRIKTAKEIRVEKHMDKLFGGE